jgi:4-aminobutyrate aminotransferase-like enzyme/Ser/Thr protein kinase RdoA (MazF antagonist)
LLALRSEPPEFDAVQIERIALDLYGLNATARALSGERDCNFQLETADGNAFVLKVFGAADPLAVDCQVGVLRHVAEQNAALPVPRVRPTLAGIELGSVLRDGVAFATCLLDFLPGKLLSEIAPSNPLMHSVGIAIARTDRALCGFFHAALARPLAWDVRRLPDLVGFVPLIAAMDARRAVLEAVSNVTALMPTLRGLRSQAIHGDCHGGNLLIDPALRVCGILDFGDLIHAPLSVEVAVAMAEVPGAAEREASEEFLRGYTSVQELSAADVSSLYDLIAARHATTLVLHAWRERHDPAGARLLDQAAAGAVASLDALRRAGRDALTRDWHRAAGTDVGTEPVRIDLGRRHRLLGAGAELFYEQPLHMVRGEDVWLYDADGRAHLDVYNNVAHVGHCHPTVVRAVQRQTAILATHTRYLHGRILDYAERLTARCPSYLDACIFVNSGSEANDVAWRMAQFATGHHGALVLAHAYHGITDAVAALTPGAGQPYDPRVATLSLPPPGLAADDDLPAEALVSATRDADAAIRMLAHRGHTPAAFFLDSACTSSGIYDPPPEWSTVLEGRVRQAGGLIVADEVQYGLGRSGSHFWGFERRGMTPDFITLGKPIGNGYPIGVVIARRPMVEAFQAKYGFFSTFGGNAVAASAGLAVLEVIDRENLLENAMNTGRYLRFKLEQLAVEHACLGAVRGSGLLMGLEILGSRPEQSRRRALGFVNRLSARSRVLIGTEGPTGSILKLRPPLTFRAEHVDLLVAGIRAAAAEIDAAG